MMNILYISPEYPKNFQQFIVELKNEGANIYGIGNNDFYVMPENVRNSMNWYVNTNLDNFFDTRNALSNMMNLCNIDHFDLIESHNEHWLSLESKLNDEFNIDNVTPKTIGKWKRKSIQKDIFKENNIKHAKGEFVEGNPDIFKFAKKLKYPIILKPDIGVGANGVCKVNTEEELKKILPKLKTTYLMEECLKGTLLTYDGLADKNSNVIFDSSFTYGGDGVLEFISGSDPNCIISTQMSGQLRRLGQKLVKIFDIKRKFFHIEFYFDNDNYIPIEVNARPPGGHILDMMNYSIDDNLYKAWAQMITDKKISLSSPKYYCGFVGRRDRDYQYNHNELYQNFKKELVDDFVPDQLHWKAMGQHIYIFRSTNKNKMLDITSKIRESKCL